MTEIALSAMTSPQAPPSALRRSLTIGLIGFLTLVDLFAAQAILPSLAQNYGVSPSEIGVAANASTIGMAIAGLLAGALAGRLERRRGIWLSLALLAIPTFLLASAPNLTIFALLRIVQGLCMASAFTLTLAYLGERCSKADAAGALAAYVTGGVASNLVGRLAAASVASIAGAPATFYFFAALNLAGAALAAFALTRADADGGDRRAGAPLLVRLGGASRRSAPAPRFRDRLPDPVRLHRHLHLCRLRARRAAAGAVDDGDRLRLLRLPAVDGDNAARRRHRQPVRRPPGAAGGARRRARPAWSC